jgi:hypothetical protein
MGLRAKDTHPRCCRRLGRFVIGAEYVDTEGDIWLMTSGGMLLEWLALQGDARPVDPREVNCSNGLGPLRQVNG